MSKTAQGTVCFIKIGITLLYQSIKKIRHEDICMNTEKHNLFYIECLSSQSTSQQQTQLRSSNLTNSDKDRVIDDSTHSYNSIHLRSQL